MQMRPLLLSCALTGILGGVLGLSGCAAPIVMGAAATAGYVGLQERSTGQIVMDTKVQTHIKDRLVGENYKYFSNISVDVFEGEALLTGVVPDAESGQKVLELVRTTPDVKQIYNELFVGPAYEATQKAQDAWIGTQVRTRLLGNRQAFPINYKISVVNGHVYIIGYVTSDAEHEHVLHILRTTQTVKQVHDYLRMSETGEDPRKEEAWQTDLSIQPAPAMPEKTFER